MHWKLEVLKCWPSFSQEPFADFWECRWDWGARPQAYGIWTTNPSQEEACIKHTASVLLTTFKLILKLCGEGGYVAGLGHCWRTDLALLQSLRAEETKIHQAVKSKTQKVHFQGAETRAEVDWVLQNQSLIGWVPHRLRMWSLQTNLPIRKGDPPFGGSYHLNCMAYNKKLLDMERSKKL